MDILYIAGIFVGALLVDILHTRYIRSVAAGRRTLSAVHSSCIVLLTFVIWGSVLTRTDTHGIVGIIALTLGSGLGTYLGFRKMGEGRR